MVDPQWIEKPIFDDMPSCLNCKEDLTGAFCSNCGQRAKVKPLTIRNVLLEIPTALFNFENRYWNTIRSLFRNPYSMVKEYASGRRRHFAPPIQFFFFFATLSVLLNLMLYSEVSTALELEMSYDEAEDTPWFIQNLKIAILYLEHISTSYTNYFEMALPFFLGLTTRSFFFKRLTWVEAMVFAFFALGLTFELPGLITGLFGNGDVVQLVDAIILIGGMLYLYSFIGKNKVFSIVKGLMSMTLALLLFVIVLWFSIALLVPILPELSYPKSDIT